MFQQARKKLAAFGSAPEQVIMIGDTMETDIRGAFEAGLQSYLVLSGSTQFEMVGDYVYQPTRVLQSVAELVEEVKTGKPGNPIYTKPPENGSRSQEHMGIRHQTDIFALYKPRPRPAMTK